MRQLLSIGLLLGWLVTPLHGEATKSVRLVLPPDPAAVVGNVGGVFARQIEQRCAAKVVIRGDAPLAVELALSPGIGAEGFRIENRPGGGVRIVGNDDRGLLYGAGKFLRTSRYDQGGFTPSMWRGASVPQKPVRGIYFATHFHNFYHDAPAEEVQHYVEELGLWGYNTLVVWYDMHHFDGHDDPKAVAFRKHLHAVLDAARRIGLDVGLIVIANEAYNDSPSAVRADPSAQRGGWYDCAVCPSRPGGMQYVLEVLGREFDWCADLDPRYVCIWPYDQGGCGCAQCRPWGNNGFLKASEAVAALARRELPATKIILSTWYFDEAEWKGLHKAFAEKKPFVDYILSEGTARPVPAALPMVGFPEISMHDTFPWGGFGATPLTRRAEQQWNAVKKASSGGFPYSEGIYEDITKAVIAQLYWNDRPADETVREYAAFEYSPDVVNEIVQVVKTLEQNHHMRWWPGKLEGVELPMNWFPSRGVLPRSDPGAEAAYATVQRVDTRLIPQARKAWRWRQLYLRALLDSELKTNGGRPNDRCNAAFAELIEIYHAEKAYPCVRPPLPPKRCLNGTPYYLRGGNIELHLYFEDPLCGNRPWDRAWVKKLIADIPKRNAYELSLPIPGENGRYLLKATAHPEGSRHKSPTVSCRKISVEADLGRLSCVGIPIHDGGNPQDKAVRATTSVRLVLPPEPGPIVGNVGQAFARQVQQRCAAKVITSGDAPLTVHLAVSPGIGTEGFRIEDRPGGGVRIVGNDERGLLYGAGKFLRTSRYDQGGFTPGAWRGTSVPVCPVRGVYFATHFNNFYEAAPIEEVRQYVEDLALWGVNSLVLHFPHWQFQGFDDPAARKSLDRLKQIMRAAHAVGMRVGLIEAANDAFKSSPKELRNTSVPDPLGRHGNFGVQLCPAKPRAHDLLLRDWDRLLDEFADVGLDFIIYWPYDEGGCGCKDCWPWGARGYPKLCRELSRSVRAKHPKARIVLSTWTFDTPPCGEWEGLTKALAEDKNWLDDIQADAHEDFPRYPLEKGVPGALPLLNFPEISMWGQSPWGGYGANPLPGRLQRLWNQTQKKLAGGFPYSEGIYEDLNKVVYSQFYWDPARPATETVKEYLAFEYGAAVADQLVEVVETLEKNHLRNGIGPGAIGALETVQRVEARLTPQAKSAWRWRVLFLRALIDRELFGRQGRREGAALKEGFDELTRIYHAENAHSMPIKPPQVR